MGAAYFEWNSGRLFQLLIGRPFVILFFMALLTACMPSMCQAKEGCPWLNEATAAGALGGPVTSTVAHPGKNSGDANCEFVYRDGSTALTLEIDVETMAEGTNTFASYTARCGPNVEALRAIGNEAVACSLPIKKKAIAEQVVGRVRDRAFIVRVTSNTDSLEPIVLRQKARKIAEQVAGFLF